MQFRVSNRLFWSIRYINKQVQMAMVLKTLRLVLSWEFIR